MGHLAAVLGPTPLPPKTASTLEVGEVVERMLDQGIEMVAMWQRLREY